MYKSYTCIEINTGSLFLIGETVPFTLNMNKTAAPSNCAVVCVTREDIVVANATTKKVNEQDTKTFLKCYVGRNGKRNQQKLHIQECGSLKTQRNQGCHD